MKQRLLPRLLAEGLGTAFLLAIVVGSGIMAERLSGGNMAIALLANTLATGAGLIALILAFSPISSQFNPVVTLMVAIAHELPWREVPATIAAQFAGGYAGVAAAHIMFDLPLLFASTKTRAGFAQMFSEFVATFGLLLVIASVARHQSKALPYAVGAYISAAYWFTASTSFANPAVTFARAASDTFSGIRSSDVGGFVLAQLLALAAAILVVRVLFGRTAKP